MHPRARKALNDSHCEIVALGTNRDFLFLPLGPLTRGADTGRRRGEIHEICVDSNLRSSKQLFNPFHTCLPIVLCIFMSITSPIPWRGPLDKTHVKTTSIRSFVDVFYSLSRPIIVWSWNKSYSMDNHRVSSQLEIPAPTPSRNDTLYTLKGVWMREQEVLKSRLVLQDDFSWTLGAEATYQSGSSSSDLDVCAHKQKDPLRYVGGVDLSFSKSNPSFACGALVVLDFETLEVVYEDYCTVQLTMPYIPGFLAFRESPVLVNLLDRMERKGSDFYPQLLMVDGNGILHPRGFGLASHLGVLTDIPTIGVGKNLFHVDGLTDHEVRLEISKSDLHAGETVPLIGKSGRVWGAALRSHEGCTKPIFISSGHRISLETAVDVVRRCCRHRIPEPVRQADMRSRERLRLMNHEAV